jgi:hypothetical protein
MLGELEREFEAMRAFSLPDLISPASITEQNEHYASTYVIINRHQNDFACAFAFAESPDLIGGMA